MGYTKSYEEDENMDRWARKLFSAALAGVMAMSIVACGAEKEQSAENDGEQDAEVVGEDYEVVEYADDYSDEAIFNAADGVAPAIDISDCDTFTQIVDKLDDGMGYTNVKIGDEDVLIVCSATYDNMDGNMAAIDGTIFMYNDGVPYEVGKVCSGGTAYPLAISGNTLYSASNHWVCRYTIANDQLLIIEKAFVEYSQDGNEYYSYEKIDDYTDSSTPGEPKDMFDEMFAREMEAEVINFDTIGGATASSALPAYEYPGPELFYSVLYQYIIDEFGQYYDSADVAIPCPIIVAQDESDKSDIKVYGDFWIFNYDLNGETLECVSGGSHPGCIHVKSTDAGYEVTGFDAVADGSDFNPTAKEIFGNYYDDFMKAYSDKDTSEEIRAQIIANYVFANNLSITEYKDYGWDPVALPEENIDTFYSDL